uniref:Chromo domain-containing protein n=1 Tax=Kwoniella bestiolae CBS 10118 TaxID=1296100 RepID=A0A1B9FS98_9TREE|nr:hypothetical protein I302_08419 [Kwoniella bestiolae CBS 10118]OCF21643.1 hypothetical protein I302_08419 [Kwoniella bestiolae CBS 10118]
MSSSFNTQLPTPTSSFSTQRDDPIPSSSRNRSYRPSPTPSSSTQPTQSITQELFRITQLLLPLEREITKSSRKTDDALEYLKTTIDERFSRTDRILEEIREEGRRNHGDLRGLIEGLGGRLEGLERVCKYLAGREILSGNGTGQEGKGSGSGGGTREGTPHSNGVDHQDGASRNGFLGFDRDGTQEIVDGGDKIFDGSLDDSAFQDEVMLDDNDNVNGDDNQGLFMDLDNDNGFQPLDMEVGINPQEIMRSPSPNVPSLPLQLDEGESSRGMREKIAAVLSREKESSEIPPPDNLNEAGYEEPVPTRSRRSARVSTHHQKSTISPDPSQSSSLTPHPDVAEEDEEGSGTGSSKPPARLPFPPRSPASPSSGSPNTQIKKRARARRQNLENNHDQVQVRRSRDSTFEPTTTRSHNHLQDEVENSSESPKKRRRKGNTGQSTVPKPRSSIVKTEDKKPHPNSKYTQKGTARIRKFKGQVRLAQKCLAPSDGDRATEATWPNKGPNTAKGRLEEIICDTCKGRCHWSCAGIPEEKDMSQENWICPDCEYKVQVQETPAVLIDTAQQLKCIRYNCILREKRAIEHQAGEEERYFVEKVVGRKAVAREPDSQKRIFKYLVKWDGYELGDCTWEPLENLEHHSERLLAKFEDSAKRTKSNLKLRVCILPEARKFWDEVTGDAIVDATKSESEGEENDQDEDEDEDEDEDGEKVGGEELEGVQMEMEQGGDDVQKDGDKVEAQGLADEDEAMIIGNGDEDGDDINMNAQGVNGNHQRQSQNIDQDISERTEDPSEPIDDNQQILDGMTNPHKNGEEGTMNWMKMGMTMPDLNLDHPISRIKEKEKERTKRWKKVRMS